MLQGGTRILADADMNSDTYKVPGNYYTVDNATVATLKNAPFNNGFILKVEYSLGNSQPRQIFTNYLTGQRAIRRFNGNEWLSYVYFSDDATLISSNRIWRTVSVYSNGDFKDCNDIPVNCVGNAFSTALNRPNDGTSQLLAIICIGSEVDKYKAQYAFPSQTYINKIQYRFYSYIDQEWSEWTSI